MNGKKVGEKEYVVEQFSEKHSVQLEASSRLHGPQAVQ